MTLTQGGVTVSIVHSEHPSGGARLARNHHGTRYSTLGFPPKKMGENMAKNIFGAPKTAITTLGGGWSGDSERAALRFGPGGSDPPHPIQPRKNFQKIYLKKKSLFSLFFQKKNVQKKTKKTFFPFFSLFFIHPPPLTKA